MMTNINDGKPLKRLEYWEGRLRFYNKMMEQKHKISQKDIHWAETMIFVARVQLCGVKILLVEYDEVETHTLLGEQNA